MGHLHYVSEVLFLSALPSIEVIWQKLQERTEIEIFIRKESDTSSTFSYQFDKSDDVSIIIYREEVSIDLDTENNSILVSSYNKGDLVVVTLSV